MDVAAVAEFDADEEIKSKKARSGSAGSLLEGKHGGGRAERACGMCLLYERMCACACVVSECDGCVGECGCVCLCR